MRVAAAENHTYRTGGKPSLLIVSILGLLLAYLALGAYTGSLLPMRLVKGDSMEPGLMAGDIVLVKKTPVSQIKVGDVVAFSTAESVDNGGAPSAVLHRVTGFEVSESGQTIVTAGDNSGPDPFQVPVSNVQRKMIARIPFVGLPVVFLTSTKGVLFISIGTLLALLYVPAMVIFYLVVLKGRSKSQESPDSMGEEGDGTLVASPEVQTLVDDHIRELISEVPSRGEEPPFQVVFPTSPAGPLMVATWRWQGAPIR